jgi:N-acetylneuraminic acid mutarotase
MYVYNTATNSTHEAASMPHALHNYGMTLLTGDSVLVCGGNTGDVHVAICSLYTISVNAWTSFTSLPAIVDHFPMLTLNGRPYVFGGDNDTITMNTVYAYDSAKKMWNVRAPMPTALSAHTAVVFGDMNTALVYAHSV